MNLSIGEHDIAVVLRFDESGMQDDVEVVLSASRNKGADLMGEMLIEVLSEDEFGPMWALARQRVKEKNHA